MADKITDAKQQQASATAQQINIAAAKELASYVRSTLGPMGMDKMLVDTAMNSVVTNDGATILKETKITHPTAKMIVEVAQSQEENCYDGTTSSVVLTGELMRQAEDLLSRKIHPTKIAKGYVIAGKRAEELLDDITIDVTDELLYEVARTAMTGKTAETEKDALARICVEVAQATTLDNISITRRSGGKISESLAISGILVDREKVHHNMPDVVEGAKIALIDVDITLPEFAQQIQVQVSDNTAVQEFIESRKDQLIDIADQILSSGATAVFCMRDIDRFIQEHFAKKGIYAARRVARSDIESISKATNARIISSIDELTEDDLGSADRIEEVQVGDKPLVKVTGTPTSEAVSVLIRAPTQHVVDEVKRAFDDAVGVVSVAYENGKVLPGGGASYLYLSKELKEYASTIGGREQMAVEAFANTLEIIPSALAENSGLDPLDTLIALRQAHTTEGGSTKGVNVEDGGYIDMIENGVVEPLEVVAQAIVSASNIAAQILRIDNIIEMRAESQFGDDDFDY